MNEWDFDGEIGVGARGRRARLVQEWLCLHGVNVVVDGRYGPATAAAVRAFQSRAALRATGTVNRTTFEAMLAPLAAARRPLPAGPGLGSMTVAYAEQHLGQHPREIGGQNMGPWVRLYMKGNEGSAWPWCAGFACFVLGQAAATLAAEPPVAASFSCDLLASDATTRGCFLPGSRVRTARDVPVGSLFLSRRVAGDWVHTGIVAAVDGDTFETIEGNTNDAGDREGYEVCRRVRGLRGKDFIVVA